MTRKIKLLSHIGINGRLIEFSRYNGVDVDGLSSDVEASLGTEQCPTTSWSGLASVASVLAATTHWRPAMAISPEPEAFQLDSLSLPQNANRVPRRVVSPHFFGVLKGFDHARVHVGSTSSRCWAGAVSVAVVQLQLLRAGANLTSKTSSRQVGMSTSRRAETGSETSRIRMRDLDGITPGIDSQRYL